MRHIPKNGPVPAAIRDFLQNQSPVGHGLDYKTFSQTASPGGGSRGRQLCKELTAEQYGLCAYTGCGIDERLGKLSDPSQKLKFESHNEHIKPQSVCKNELINAGKPPGIDLGDDMAYSNMVAALLVSGIARSHVAAGNQRANVRCGDLFGASHRENECVPVPPTDPTCEHRFIYNVGTGKVSAQSDADAAAQTTIDVLNLNHETLKGWRRQAVSTFLDIVESRSDLQLIIAKTTTPDGGKLPEFCFAIRQAAERLVSGG